MAKYTATLSAQNTSVYVCDIVKPRHADEWFANVMSTGTFGTGTVTWNISFDSGVTLIPLTQDGRATAATQTAAGALNIRAGHMQVGTTPAKLYASVATATNPSIALTAFTNN